MAGWSEATTHIFICSYDPILMVLSYPSRRSLGACGGLVEWEVKELVDSSFDGLIILHLSMYFDALTCGQ